MLKYKKAKEKKKKSNKDFYYFFYQQGWIYTNKQGCEVKLRK